jgi:DNA-binding NarL/FixJ family response regulator
MQSEAIRVLIVDDHPVVRAGLSSMLATYPDLEVMDSVSDGRQAIARIKQDAPDMVLLDLRMPRLNGIETLQELKRLKSASRVIILTSYESDEDIYQSIRSGAQGYLLKASSKEEMIDAIHKVCAGERYLPAHIATRFADRVPRSHLNSRQVEILEWIARGMTDEQVAEKLNLSVDAVWDHLNTIIETLDASESADVNAASGTALPAQKITIADVARKAGVSMATVSRVLHNKGKHTEETRQAVMKVVREYDFQLNGTAASLAMMRTNSSQD